uniref:RRM domain-containing protein n=1 Tax=Caenorhabditis tropicalis TaxID=1561998 RepID=A0A1I7UL71_9PELO
MPIEFQVLCRGLPWEATEQDLKDFFENSGIESLDIPKRNGRTCGDATVTFTNEDDYKRALKKDREHLGSRYIEVFPSDSAPRRRGDREDFRPRGGPPRDRYYDRSGPRSNTGGPDSIVRLRGLPFSVTVRDINDFLAPLPIVRDGILLPDQQRARPGGEAYVCFESMESVQIAKQRHMKNIGHRYIEVFEATHRELTRFAEENGLRVPRFGPTPFSSPPSGPPRGAYDPYQVDGYRNAGSDYRRSEPEDSYGRSRPVAADYGARAYDPYQQPASTYPAHQTPQPAGGYYDNNYAPTSAYDSYGRERPDPRDVRDSREPMRDTRDPPPRDSRHSDSRSGESRAHIDPYNGDSRYPDYGYESRDSYWRGSSGGQPANGGGSGMVSTGRDPYSVGDSWASGGGAGGPPASNRERYGSGGYTSEPYGQREAGGPLRRTDYGRPDDRDRYPKHEPYGYGRDREYSSHSSGAPQNQHFVLRMRGVPFRATEADVYEFFHPIRPNQIELIRDNQFQRPSGDARVIFYNRKDYDDALMKDKQYMGERYIEMIPDNGRY